MAEAASLKLGAGEWHLQTPFCYPDVYAVEETTGPQRLVVGPAGDHVEVLLSLAEVWQQDYYLLYVLEHADRDLVAFSHRQRTLQLLDVHRLHTPQPATLVGAG